MMIDLNKYRMKAKGDPMFLGCPCGEDAGFAVVCVASGDAPVIAGLVCLSCEKESGVAFGKVGD